MRLARGALAVVLLFCGSLLTIRAVWGPVFGIRSPMNLEAICALAFLGLVLSRDTPASESLRSAGSTAPYYIWLAAIVVAAFAAYLNFPLLADDYSHIWKARHADGKSLAAHFTAPESDGFFRPLVYASYAMDAQWAGLSPAWWRGVNLSIHVINTLLVFRLCLAVGLLRFGAFVGALIFGLHGSRPEAVTWVAARFDLLAVMFSLACLLAVLRSAPAYVTGSLLLLALFSKESAYVVPAIAVLLLWSRRLAWASIARKTLPLFAIAAVAFAYRLFLFQGIGGYRNAADGSAVVFHFGVASTLNALLLRFWAVLLFPLNWTNGLELPVAIAFLLALLALGYVGWRGGVRRKVVLGVGIATLCSLPVHQFLSISPDLEKSRVLYFASVGLAVLFAALFQNEGRPAIASAVCLIVFPGLALEHNLAVWKRVGLLAQLTCHTAATLMPASVIDLPNVVDGVYFLHTGFPECMQFQEEKLAQGPGYFLYRWNASTRTLERP